MPIKEGSTKYAIKICTYTGLCYKGVASNYARCVQPAIAIGDNLRLQALFLM